MKTKTLAILVILSGLNLVGYTQSIQRLVLLEQFTNAGCPTCGTYTPQITQFVEANPSQVITIAYHTEFPHFDSLYYENPSDVDAKVAYYSIQYAPASVLDGNQFQGSSPSLLPNIASTVSSRATTAPQYDIEFQNATISDDQLSGSIKFKSLIDNTNANLKAQIAVVEKNVLKSDYLSSPGSNSETEYKYVMRKILPDASGTTLENRGENQKDSLSFNWLIRKVKSLDEIRVIAFVQNLDTKEILQSAIFTPTFSTGIDDVKNKPEFAFYPNPTNGILHIEGISTEKIKVVDMYGRNMAVIKTKTTMDVSALASGTYFILGENSTQMFVKI
jgi:hypothetical protein